MQRNTVVALALVAVLAIGASFPAYALAQPHQGGGHHSVVFIGGYFYDPFFGPYPWWGFGAYPYPYFPVYDNRADVRVLVTPKEAAVYVDGYYAGVVDDFDGALQSLPLSPGAHEIAVFLDGYQTVHQRLYLAPGKSYKLRYTLQRLASGEHSEPPQAAPPVPPPPSGSATLPRTALPGVPSLELSSAVSVLVPSATGFGTLAIRTQPDDAEITIDGERWTASQPGDRLLVQMTEGRHHVEIRKSGYRPYSADVTVLAGETAPLNVSLSAQ